MDSRCDGGTAELRSARIDLRPTWAWATLALLAASCGADEGTRAAAPTVEPPRVAAAPAAPVAGAAAPIEVEEIPEDVEPLASRLAPRPLPIPALRQGHSATFTFDGDRQGWFARLPEHERLKLVTPVYGHGKVFVGGGFSSYSFYGIDAKSGRIDWVSAAEDGGPTAGIVSDGEVIFNTESCTLFVVDAETGRLRWKRWLGDPLMGQAAAAGGRVFSGHIRDEGGYGFTAMDLETGRILWTRNITADVMNAPILDDTDVYFTTMDGVVWSFRQEDGRARWRQRLHASSAPWLDGETVHVARREVVRDEESNRRRRTEQTVVLAKADGALLREAEPVDAAFVPHRPDHAGVEAGWVYEGSRPTIVDGRAYQTIGAEVQSRDAETGELLWRRRYTERVRTRPASPPAVAGSQLVFGTTDGVLYGLDIDTGMTAWAYEVGEPITAQPTVARGWVYASTTRGGVVGIQVSDSSVGGWHMWGGNARHNGFVDETDEPEAADDDRPGEGTLRLSTEVEAGELPGFPLKNTEVDARVDGLVARVRVEQTFDNPYERAVEAVYLFPLPDDAAVDAMELRTGDRVVRGAIRTRQDARREYRQARSRGVLAALLEQERPNLFRQSIANVRPGDEVRVVLEYTQALPYEEGAYRFVYPMVAGPRYTPATAEEEDESTAGSDVRQVVAADAERRDRVHVSIAADMGAALFDVTSPTHDVQVERSGEAAATVSLGRDGVRPDRDLDVRFRVAGDGPTTSVFASPPAEGDDGYLTIALHPRLSVPDEEVAARELVFVVDTSSSMNGRPMELAKAAMLEALDGMGEGDTFRIVRFSDRASELSDEPLPVTAENVERGKRFVRRMQALGATEMTRGVHAALAAPADRDRMRVVLLMTDGYIGHEAEVLRVVDRDLGQARVFAFGVGSAVNRYLLTRVAEVGRGDLQVVTLDESPQDAARAFHERIARPYLTDVTLDWGGLGVHDVYPRRVPDLYADRPLVVHGRFGRAARGTVTVRGRIAGRAFEQELAVTLPGSGEPSRELPSLWARTRIRDLMTAMSLRPNDALREEITQLGLRHSLLTQWTAFVAVDEGYRTDEEGAPVRVDQATTVPAGVNVAAAPRTLRAMEASAAMGTLAGGTIGHGYGYGGLGLAGVGAGGGGSGYGRGAGALEARPAAPLPDVAGEAGYLPSADVTAVVRGAAAEVRAAYETSLRSDPEASGRVTVLITIAPDGSVISVVVTEDTVGNGTGGRVAAVVRSLEFPSRSDGQTVTVSVPFVFAPSD